MSAAKNCTAPDCRLPQFKNGYCVDHHRKLGSSSSSSSSAADSEFVPRFKALAEADLDDQVELFLKSFIFDLGDNWKIINQLEKAFRKMIADSGEGKPDLNPIMAADFLQKNGLERTSIQRKDEIADIDLDHNNRIAFIEYLMLHFKCMILQAYEKRTGRNLGLDYTKGGVGITGVGNELLEELFTMPLGLDPALIAAIEEFTAKKKAKESKLKELEAKAAAGGVKGLAAANEIAQLETADQTEMNRIELTLNAAKKRTAKDTGEVALKKKQEEEAAAAREKQQASKAALAAKAALWENK